MKLRDYQNACYASITNAFDSGHDNVLAVLATGLGKTIIFSELANRWSAEGRGRVLVICPAIELVKQAAAKLEQVTGSVPSIEQGSKWSDESGFYPSDFVVSCKASLISDMGDGRKRYERFTDIGLIVIDEAHLAATAQYKEIVDYFGCKLLGVTATPKRHDKVAMSEMFDHVAYTYGIKDGINDGWLVGCRTQCIQLQSLDLSTVGTKGKHGDFVAAQLGKVMADDETVFEVADITAKESHGQKTVVFAASVDQAMKISGVLQDVYSINSEWVCGDKSRCPDEKRQSVLDSFRNDPNGVQVVCNVGVLTTGFDFPGLEHIVMARPTKSESLFTQIFGRGTRALDGVVDFEGSTPELRKQRIKDSAKPHFRFTDLRDVSLQHRLVTPVDILAGDFTIEEREKAKELLENAGEDRDLSEVLQEASEAVKQREAAERARLAQLQAEANYTTVEVDPFMEGVRVVAEQPKERGARMPYGKYKGELIKYIDRSYLAYMRREFGFKQEWLRKAVDERLGLAEATA